MEEGGFGRYGYTNSPLMMIIGSDQLPLLCTVAKRSQLPSLQHVQTITRLLLCNLLIGGYGILLPLTMGALLFLHLNHFLVPSFCKIV